jgi:hypothetical protein
MKNLSRQGLFLNPAREIDIDCRRSGKLTFFFFFTFNIHASDGQDGTSSTMEHTSWGNW